MHNVKEHNSSGTLRKPLISKADQKKGFSFLGSIKSLKKWEMVRRSDEARLTLFQSGGASG